jgi:predicted amidophosphoribosyltransferase
LTAVSSLDERGFVVRSAFRHEGVARRLTHLLKYHAIATAADLLASAMLPRLPAGTSALVPVPRAWVRRVRHGVDPAIELSRRLAQATGIPVVLALRPQLWWPSHAGSDRVSRRSPGFRQVAAVPSRAVLIDDVVTTGVTLRTAGYLVSIRSAVTATRALGSSFDRMT